MSCHPESMPVMKAMCATCPFNPKNPRADIRALAPSIAESAKANGRICHSTEPNGAVYGRKPPVKGGIQICRGARDLQLQRLHATGFLDAATDEAWQRKCDELGMVRDRMPKRRRKK